MDVRRDAAARRALAKLENCDLVGRAPGQRVTARLIHGARVAEQAGGALLRLQEAVVLVRMEPFDERPDRAARSGGGVSCVESGRGQQNRGCRAERRRGKGRWTGARRPPARAGPAPSRRRPVPPQEGRRGRSRSMPGPCSGCRAGRHRERESRNPSPGRIVRPSLKCAGGHRDPNRICHAGRLSPLVSNSDRKAHPPSAPETVKVLGKGPAQGNGS